MTGSGSEVTNGCEQLDSGAVELYYYDELPAANRAATAAHVAHCRACTAALGDMNVIRAALASRPDVSGPPAGDWSNFMARLDTAVLTHRATSAGADRSNPGTFEPSTRRTLEPSNPGTLEPWNPGTLEPSNPGTLEPSNPGTLKPSNPGTLKPSNPGTLEPSNPRTLIGLLATAALLTLVTISVVYLARTRAVPATQLAATTSPAEARANADATPTATAGMRSVGEQHLERSKLVVLGVASKKAGDVSVSDWAYERSLASSLLNDTRLYRLAAEERGLTSLAGVMRDLELVLLETSMAEGSDPAALPQIQRLIQKRQLIQKMNVVNTVGLVP